MSRFESRAGSRLRARRSSRLSSDCTGFTLVELLVALTVMAVISALTFSLITGFLSNQSSVTATYQGIDQAELASRTFTQYLRSATSVEIADPTELVFTSFVGLQAGEPVSEVIDAVLSPATATLDTMDLYFGYNPNPTAPATPLSNATLIAAYDVTPPPAGSAAFTYYTFTDGALTTLVDPGSSLSSIQGIGVDLTFLPPPGSNHVGPTAELATTLQTTTILRNDS